MKSARRMSELSRQFSLLFGLLVGLGLFTTKSALAAEYYVAPTGSDSNPGTQASPWGTVQKAASTAAAGDTSTSVPAPTLLRRPVGATASSSRRAGHRTPTNQVLGLPGRGPVIDFTNMKVSSSGYTMGMHVTAATCTSRGSRKRASR